MPGEMGLYLKDKLPNFLYKMTEKFFSRMLQKKVTIPVSVIALAPYLQEAGFDLTIIDGRVEDPLKRLDQELDDNVIYVGISALTGSSIYFGLECARHIRKKRPDIPLVWGGVHVTLNPDNTLETSDFVDIVARGEGEFTAVDLAQCLSEGGDIANVAGISYKKDGKVVHNEDRPFMDFEGQLEMDYSIVDLNKYDLDRFLYQSERGCPHRCTFCDVVIVHRRRFRKKIAETVVQDMLNIQRKYNPKMIQYVDDCFFADFKRANKIIDGLIEMEDEVEWHASCRAQYYRKTTVDIWKRAKEAGLVEVYVGSESGSQRVLDYILKDCTVDDIRLGAQQSQEAGIMFLTNFMLGFPIEEQEDVEASMDLIDEIQETYAPYVNVGRMFLFAPCPGTPLAGQVEEAGFIPPTTFEGWGDFRIGHRSHTEWHPLVDYLWAVSVVSYHGKKFDWNITKQRFKRMNLPGITLDILGHIAYYRWKHRYFKYPVDLKLADSIYRYFYLW